MSPFTRRQVLSGAAGVTLAFITGCAPRRRPGPSTEPITPTIELPTPSALPAAPTVQAVSLPPDEIVITSNDQFYRTHWKDPSVGVDIGDWRLEIDGLIDHPLRLTFDEILALPSVQEMRTLECIGNPVGGNQIGNAVWKGFYLEELLKQAGVQEQAIRAQFAAADGYWTSVDLEWITQPGVLMACETAAQARLSPAHPHAGSVWSKEPQVDHRHSFHRPDRAGLLGGARLVRRGLGADQLADLGAAPPKRRGHALWRDRRARRRLRRAARDCQGRARDQRRGMVRRRADPRPLAFGLDPMARRVAGPPGDYRLRVRAADSAGFTQASGGSGVLAGSFPDGTNAIAVVEREGIQ